MGHNPKSINGWADAVTEKCFSYSLNTTGSHLFCNPPPLINSHCLAECQNLWKNRVAVSSAVVPSMNLKDRISPQNTHTPHIHLPDPHTPWQSVCLPAPSVMISNQTSLTLPSRVPSPVVSYLPLTTNRFLLNSLGCSSWFLFYTCKRSFSFCWIYCLFKSIVYSVDIFPWP